jgi:hypothetical protein
MEHLDFLRFEPGHSDLAQLGWRTPCFLTFLARRSGGDVS